MDKTQDVLKVLDEVLSLQGRAMQFKSDTPLLGGLPQLDSMAVVGVITALEDHFGITIDDDEIDGSTFATVASLAGFVNNKTRG
jgi:acyl carrier protein